jgi:Protein of unknwon function (DUF3310)
MTYKYNEDIALQEIKAYIDKTYDQHYSKSKIQATEYIVDQQQSLDFLTGNVIKYISRLGKKDGFNKNDVLKAIHYCIMTLYYIDEFEKSDNS